MNDNYCYNYYTQSEDDINSGVSNDSLCPHSTSNTNGITDWFYIVITLVAGAVLVAVVFYLIRRFKLSSATSSIQPVHVPDTSNTIELQFHEEGDGGPVGVHEFDYLHMDSVEGASTELPRERVSMVSNAASVQSLRSISTMSNVNTVGSRVSSAGPDHANDNPYRLQRVVQFGKYWNSKCPEEMMEEWDSSFIYGLVQLRRRREDSGGGSDIECQDSDCGWSQHQKYTVLYPHQLVHSILHHFDGISVLSLCPCYLQFVSQRVCAHPSCEFNLISVSMI